MKNLVILLLSLFISCNNESSENNDLQPEITQELVEIYLINNLNDTRGYCIDVRGYKTNANVNSSLQAHTCYSYQGEISVDQGFDSVKIVNNEFYINHFEVCMEADKIESSSNVNLSICDKNDKQKFILQSDGKIQLKTNLSLCLTVSESFEEGGGGNPIHLIRTLTLQNCNDEHSSRQKWGTRKSN